MAGKFLDETTPSNATSSNTSNGGGRFLDETPQPAQNNAPLTKDFNLFDAMKQGAKDTFGPSLSLLQGVSNVGQSLIGKPINTLASKASEMVTGKPVIQDNTNFAQNVLGEDSNLIQNQAAQGLGEIIGNTALTSPIGAVGALAKGAPLLGRAAATIGSLGAEGAAQGLVQNQIDNKENTVGNVAQNAGINTFFGAVVPKVAKIGGFLGKQVLGKVTGTSADTIEQAFKSGGSDDFMKYLRGEKTSSDILDNVKRGLDEFKKDSKAIYGKAYDKLVKNKTDIPIDDIKEGVINSLGSKNGYNIKFDIGQDGNFTPNFSESTIADPSHQKEITNAISEIQNWKDTSPLGMDILKRRVQSLYKGTQDSKIPDAIVADLANQIKDRIVKNVPEYGQMSSDYSKYLNTVNDINAAINVGGKNKNTAITKLNGLLRENNQFRQQMIDVLEKHTGKDIKGQVAGQQLNPILSRGLAGVGVGGAGLAALFQPQILIPLLATSPRLVGETANALGRSAKKLNNIIKKGGYEGLVKNIGNTAKTAVNITAQEALNSNVSNNE